MPAETMKTLKPRLTVTNLFAIKLQVIREAMKIPTNIIYN